MFQVKALAGSEPSSGSVPSPLYEITSPARNCAPSFGEEIVAVGRLPTLDRDRRGGRGVDAVGDGQPRLIVAGGGVGVRGVRGARGGPVAEVPRVGEGLALGIGGPSARERDRERRGPRGRRGRRGVHHRCLVGLDAAVHVGLDLGRAQHPAVDANLVDQAAPALDRRRISRLTEDQRLGVGNRRGGLGRGRDRRPVEVEHRGVRGVVEDRGEVRPLIQRDHRGRAAEMLAATAVVEAAADPVAHRLQPVSAAGGLLLDHDRLVAVQRGRLHPGLERVARAQVERGGVRDGDVAAQAAERERRAVFAGGVPGRRPDQGAVIEVRRGVARGRAAALVEAPRSHQPRGQWGGVEARRVGRGRRRRP